MGRRVVTAAAAATGGVLWTVKAAAVLAGAGQPPHLFELAPAAFAVVALLLARAHTTGGGRRLPVALGVVAVAASALAAAWALATGEVLGPAMMLGIIAMLASLGLTGRSLRRGGRHPVVARTALALAVGTVPAVLVGGALSLLDERLLELPILVVGAGWIAFGWWLALERERCTG